MFTTYFAACSTAVLVRCGSVEPMVESIDTSEGNGNGAVSGLAVARDDVTAEKLVPPAAQRCRLMSQQSCAGSHSSAVERFWRAYQLEAGCLRSFAVAHDGILTGLARARHARRQMKRL